MTTNEAMEILESQLHKWQETMEDYYVRISEELHAMRLLCRSRKGKKENPEDQSLNDKQLVETEVATEPISQFQVRVSAPKILRNVELEEGNSVLKNLEYEVLNENLEQEGVQKNISQRFEVESDVERDQEVQGIEKICSAHQVFGKMPSREKRIKHLKGWKFKFKRKSLVGIMLQIEQCKLRERRRRMYNKVSTNIKDESMKERSMRRLTLKIMKSHRKHKWKSKIYGCETEKHMLLRVNLASRVWEHGELLATHLYRKLFGIKTLIVLESYRWEYKKQLKSEKRSFQCTYAAQIKRCEETARQICFFTDQMSKPRVLAKQILVKEYDIDLDNVEAGSKEHSHESFGTKGLAYDGCVILGMNFAGFGRGKAELLATSQRMQRIDFFSSCCSCTNQILVAIHTKIEKNLEFKQLLAAVERFPREVIEELAKRIVTEQMIEGQLQDSSKGEVESFPFLNFAAEQPLLWMQNKSEPILIVSELERKKKQMIGYKTRMFKYKAPLRRRQFLHHLDKEVPIETNWNVQGIWKTEYPDDGITYAYSVLQDEFEQVVNLTPFSVVKLERPQDHDTLLLPFHGDEMFQIKHKWRFKLLLSILELELYLDSLVLITSYAHQFDIISLIILMSVELSVSSLQNQMDSSSLQNQNLEVKVSSKEGDLIQERRVTCGT